MDVSVTPRVGGEGRGGIWDGSMIDLLSIGGIRRGRDITDRRPHPDTSSLPPGVRIPAELVAAHGKCGTLDEILIYPCTFLCKQDAERAGLFAKQETSAHHTWWYALVDEEVWRVDKGRWTNTHSSFREFLRVITHKHEAQCRVNSRRYEEKCVEGIYTPSPQFDRPGWCDPDEPDD